MIDLSAMRGVRVDHMMMMEGEERVRPTYGDHGDRLSRVKAQYDPGNVFHVNQNITPRVAD